MVLIQLQRVATIALERRGQAAKVLLSRRGPPPPPPLHHPRFPSLQYFSAIDTNRSGTLDVMELQKALALGGLHFRCVYMRVPAAAAAAVHAVAELYAGRRVAARGSLLKGGTCSATC